MTERIWSTNGWFAHKTWPSGPSNVISIENQSW